jgi:hypothetical protein
VDYVAALRSLTDQLNWRGLGAGLYLSQRQRMARSLGDVGMWKVDAEILYQHGVRGALLMLADVAMFLEAAAIAAGGAKPAGEGEGEGEDANAKTAEPAAAAVAEGTAAAAAGLAAELRAAAETAVEHALELSGSEIPTPTAEASVAHNAKELERATSISARRAHRAGRDSDEEDDSDGRRGGGTDSGEGLADRAANYVAQATSARFKDAAHHRREYHHKLDELSQRLLKLLTQAAEAGFLAAPVPTGDGQDASAAAGGSEGKQAAGSATKRTFGGMK